MDPQADLMGSDLQLTRLLFFIATMPPIRFALTPQLAMEMESSSSSFPWHQLPLHLQESILSLLPISNLIRCTAVSRSLRSLIRSPSFLSSYPNQPQPLFLFFDDSSCISDAYDPLLDRWISLRFPFDSASILDSDGPLFLFSCSPNGSFILRDLFSEFNINIPPSVISHNNSAFYPIALISESREHFKIVMVCGGISLYSQVYDSKTGEWTVKGVFDRRFTLVTNGVVIGGLLYCLSRGPDHLLTFDPVSGEWKFVDVSLPAARCSHVLCFDGKLFLVGGMEEIGAIVGIGIWELDWVRMEWRPHCFMPENDFDAFSEGGLNYFQVVGRKGKICFVSNKRHAGATILMSDLSAKRWWWPRVCERRSIEMHYCFAHAVEPYIDLVKASR